MAARAVLNSARITLLTQGDRDFNGAFSFRR
jgi:hypothetical protein